MSWLDLTADSKRLARIIEDLERIYKDTKDEKLKLDYLDRILKAQDIKQQVDATIKKHSLF